LTPVLVDTGVIVALLDRSESHHLRCARVVAELDCRLVTCEPVIAEACYLVREIPGAVDAILANVEQGVFEIPLTLHELAATVRTLVRRYRNIPADLADACLVAMADDLGTGRILTLDSDFAVYRWRRTRPFDLLLPPDR
jgi:predicted nucleic acid-binding protein